MKAHRRWLLALVLVASVASVAACGSDGDSSSDTTGGGTATTAGEDGGDDTTTTALDQAAAEVEIRALFETFFDGTDTTTDKILLVEDGETLRDLYDATGAANPGFAERTTAQVKTVTFTSDTTADVSYDILLDGTPVLEGFLGGAVLIDGTWYISKAAFCDFTVLGLPEPPPECAN